MRKRTIDDIDVEIDEIELQILNVKESIHQDTPDYREPWRRKTGDLPIGYVPLVERRKRVEILNRTIERLEKERKAMLVSQGSPSGAKMAHGELKTIVARLAKRDGYKTGDTVPGPTIGNWVREIQEEGKTTTAASIRAQLANLTITRERGKKKK